MSKPERHPAFEADGPPEGRACAFAPQQALAIAELDPGYPEARETPAGIMATGIVHTDAYARRARFRRGFPLGPGHEGAGIVHNVGPGVTSLTPGNPVIPFRLSGFRQPGHEQINERVGLMHAGTSIRGVVVF